MNDPEYYRILPNVSNIFETSRYLFYSYNFGHVNHKVFYDKYKDRKYEIDPEYGVLKDDIAGGPNFNPMFCSGGKIYSWISANELKKYVESEVLTEAQVQNIQKKEDLKKPASFLKESDNPILIIVTLKN